jgi:flagellar motor switch protein FliM
VQKLLNQEEIDAMVRAARGGTRTLRPEPGIRNVLPCDFRQAAQLRQEQVSAISELHETFANNLTHWLAAYLRVGFECNLVSVEQLRFSELNARVPDRVYLSSLLVGPHQATAAMQLELCAAFPIIDVLLGGAGRPGPQRDLTAIEEQILEDIVRIICRELTTSWEPVGASFAFEQRYPQQQFQRLMPPSEMTLTLSFELRIAESQGSLILIFPSSVSDVLLRKLAREWTYQSPRAPSDWSNRLAQLLGACVFEMELRLPPTRVPASELVRLKPGKVLALPYPVNRPVTLQIAGQEVFHAAVVRREQKVAAQLQQRLTQPLAQEK